MRGALACSGFMKSLLNHMIFNSSFLYIQGSQKSFKKIFEEKTAGIASHSCLKLRKLKNPVFGSQIRFYELLFHPHMKHIDIFCFTK